MTKEILEKLDTIIGILTIQGKNKEDQIMALHNIGFTSKKISDIIGVPEGTIGRIRATKLKKK